MTVIEREFGIPRSTLSGWFKTISLSEEQRTRLMKNSQDGWVKARINAVAAHNAAKERRIQEATELAKATLDQIDLNNSAILDLAFAMLYWGEGAKKDVTSLGSSDPKILRFMIFVLKRNYSITDRMIRCDLHLRMDQQEQTLKTYWANELQLPIECFKYAAYDKRTEGKATFGHYKGVCLITVHQIAIQRKLISLYNLFCDSVVLDVGA